MTGAKCDPRPLIDLAMQVISETEDEAAIDMIADLASAVVGLLETSEGQREVISISLAEIRRLTTTLDRTRADYYEARDLIRQLRRQDRAA